MIDVMTERCPKDHRCPMLARCPQGAISQEGFNAPRVDKDKCVECMLCVNTCPYNAFNKS